MFLWKSRLLRAVFFLMPLLVSTSLQAKIFVTLKTAAGEGTLPAEEKKVKVWVDLEGAARAFGALSYDILVKQDAFVQIEFSSYTLALNPKDQAYSRRP